MHFNPKNKKYTNYLNKNKKLNRDDLDNNKSLLCLWTMLENFIVNNSIASKKFYTLTLSHHTHLSVILSKNSSHLKILLY